MDETSERPMVSTVLVGHLQVEEGAQGDEQLQAPVIAKRGQDVDECQPRLCAPIHSKTGRPPGALLCPSLPYLLHAHAQTG